MADQFCTVPDVESFLQIDIEGIEAVTSCEMAIESATAAIRNYTNQKISEVVDDTITIDGHGRKEIYLPEIPVQSVTSVTENGISLVETVDFVLGQFGILHRLNGYVWLEGFNNIEIVYTHGYSVIPEAIKQVAIRSAARAYQAGLRARETEGVPGVAALKLGDYSVQYGSERGGGMGEGLLGVSAAQVLLNQERKLLDQYKHKRL